MSLMDLRKGDQVLHAQHGVGTITSIRNRSFSGDDEGDYVQLYFERDELMMIVRHEDLSDLVRELISSEQAKELLDHVTVWNGKPAAKWKPRAAAHQAALDSGDPFEYVKVLKVLSQLERDGSLSSSDRKHLSLSLCLLTEELACAMKQSRKQVQRLLDRAIGASR